MMHITAINLSGFKSFAEATHVPIDAGLTVIIGPNGCGKSNVIEAVRWVMGEGSAKRLRGAEMEDVIFAGTRQRRRRQSAEVSVTLDNQAGTAPAPFQDAPELVVSRRIERGNGSIYRINNKEVRAKDVQMLFADLSIGSRSASIISQGEIAELVENKPDARRLLLEEAAGIRGLHARRHDAELKLAQAATNLLRVQDILDHEQAALQHLETQARATRRYRELMAGKRYYQALFWWVQDREAASELAELRLLQQQRQSTHHGVVSAHNAATIVSTRAETDLLRARDADAQHILQVQQLRDAWQGFERQRERLEGAQARDVERSEEWQAEMLRLQNSLHQQDQRIQVLRGELAENDCADTSDTPTTPVVGHVQRLEAEIALLQQQCDADQQHLAQQDRALMRAEDRAQNLSDQQEQLTLEQADILAQDVRLQQSLAALPSLKTAGYADVQALFEAKTVAEEALAVAYDGWAVHRDRPHAVIEAKAQLDAHAVQVAELERRLESSKRAWKVWQDQQGQGLIAHWVAPPELAYALEAALGMGLSAGREVVSGYFWQTSPLHSAPVLPDGIESLWQHVQKSTDFPEDWQFLAGVLQWVGLAADHQECMRLLPELQVGQSLVTREGAGMRWDGLGHGAESARLDADQWSQGHVWQQLAEELSGHEQELAQKRAVFIQAEEAWNARFAAAEADYRLAEQERKRLDAQWQQAERARKEDEISAKAELAQRQRLELESATNSATVQRIKAQLELVVRDLVEAEAALRALQQTVPEAAVLQRQQSLETLRGEYADEKAELIRISALQEAAQAAQVQRREEAERLGHSRREMVSRSDELSQKLHSLHQRQAANDAEYRLLCTQATAAEQDWKNQDQTRQQAAGQVQAAIAQYDQAQQALHRLAMEKAQSREELVRTEANFEHKIEARSALALQAQQSSGKDVAQLAQDFDFSDKDRQLSLAAVNSALAMETRRLEALGEVNLRADIDAEDKRAELDTLNRESADIDTAITDLKGAIGELNAQGRARLLETFKAMNLLFAEHFQRLFSGGEANLVWLETDDPIAPGIDIRARPPGKAMQSVYLLSGGEKALTALALIGAVLRLKPTPICLLDEVDAALDDANVVRFCGLLAELSAGNSTMRFVIVSHHRLSMAKANHLMGVGMPERGVSRLYAVDMLEAAERIQQAD